MSELSYPQELRYTSDHEWVAVGADGTLRVGITSFAQNALGDVVYVSLPAVGDSVSAGDSCGEVESTKSVSDVFSPLDGDSESTRDGPDGGRPEARRLDRRTSGPVSGR